MELQEQVTSIALSKILKEIGIPQKSLFSWVTTTLEKDFYLVTSEPLDLIDTAFSPPEIYQDSGSEGDSWRIKEIYSAFTVAELGELLPRCYISWATPQNGEVKWICHRMEQHFATHEETRIFGAATEADARAMMLMYLTTIKPSHHSARCAILHLFTIPRALLGFVAHFACFSSRAVLHFA